MGSARTWSLCQLHRRKHYRRRQPLKYCRDGLRRLGYYGDRSGCNRLATGRRGEEALAWGSQTGHSLTPGAISLPHSGQIQWNMHPIYTELAKMPVRDTPYVPIRGTLNRLRFDLSHLR